MAQASLACATGAPSPDNPRLRSIGQGWFNAVHPDDREYILEQWRRSVEAKEIFREEQRIRRHDGVYRDFTVRVVPVLGEDGELRGWAGACRDVTEQKANLAALRASEMRSRAIREILETALAHLTLDELLPRLLDRVRDALDADNAVILLPDGAGQLRVRATSGFQAHVNTNVTVPIGRGVAGKIAVDGKPIIIRDLRQVEVVHTLFQQLLSSVAGVPLRMPDGARGALHVATAAPRDFTEDDVRLLEVVAERISVAIERAQIHEATAERAVRLQSDHRVNDRRGAHLRSGWRDCQLQSRGGTARPRHDSGHDRRARVSRRSSE